MKRRSFVQASLMGSLGIAASAIPRMEAEAAGPQEDLLQQMNADPIPAAMANAADVDAADASGVSRILQVSPSQTGIETRIAAPSALGMRGSDNSFTDPQMIDRSGYVVDGPHAWRPSLNGASAGCLVLNDVKLLHSSSRDIVALSPAMAVQEGVAEWYEGHITTEGDASAGVARARLEVEFYSDLPGTVAIARRLIAQVQTASKGETAMGAAHRAPKDARSARFVMTREGHPAAITAAAYANLAKMRYKALDRHGQFRIGDPTSLTAHYHTLQEAVDCLHQSVQPRNASFAKGEEEAGHLGLQLMIEDAHRLTEGLSVAWGDYGHFEIRSENDRDVLLSPDFVGKSALPFYARGAVGSAPDDLRDETEHLFLGYCARMPSLACTIDMENRYDNGYVAIEGSTGNVRPGYGVRRAGHNGLDVRASRVSADYTVFTGASNHALRAAYTAAVTAQGFNGDYAGQNPDPDSFNALDVSRTSIVHARLATFRHAGWKWDGSGKAVSAMAAVNVRRNSTVTLQDGDISGATGNAANKVGGIHIQHNSRVSMFRLKVNDIGDFFPVRITTGGRADGDEIEILRRPDTHPAIYFDVGGEFSGAKVVTSTVSAPERRPIEEGDISLGGFNLPTGDGICYNPNAMNKLDLGVFSQEGSSAGKRFRAPDGLLESSTDGPGMQGHLAFFNATGQTGAISTRGRTTSYTTNADATQAKDQGEVSLDKAFHLLLLWKFHDVQWETDGDVEQAAFAQDLHKVYPWAVTRGGWFLPSGKAVADGVNGARYQPWAIDYSHLIPVIARSVQGILSRCDTIESRLRELEQR